MESPDKQGDLTPLFRVSYSIFSAEEGGRKTPFYQGIRWDFRYADKAVSIGNFMIHPLFVESTGTALPNGQPIPIHGLADMVVLSPNMLDFHRQHIKVGVRGYFLEGAHRVGVCEVVELLGIYKNLEA